MFIRYEDETGIWIVQDGSFIVGLCNTEEEAQKLLEEYKYFMENTSGC